MKDTSDYLKWLAQRQAKAKTAGSLLQIKDGGETAELYIYDVIGDDFFGITAKQVASELKAAKKATEIVVRINSPGGSVFESYSIYALLNDHKATKTVKIDGVAASGASLVAMVGDTITMAKTSMMMIHEAWTIGIGRASDMRATADILDKINSQMTDLYSMRSGQKAEDVAKMLDAETWMTAEEALALGFATDINQQADRMAAFIDPKVFDYKSIPEPFTNPLTAREQIAAVKAQIEERKLRVAG